MTCPGQVSRTNGIHKAAELRLALSFIHRCIGRCINHKFRFMVIQAGIYSSIADNIQLLPI